jgi:hypothetical protein
LVPEIFVQCLARAFFHAERIVLGETREKKREGFLVTWTQSMDRFLFVRSNEVTRKPFCFNRRRNVWFSSQSSATLENLEFPRFGGQVIKPLLLMLPV